MKKIALILLALLMVVSTVACSQPAAEEPTPATAEPLKVGRADFAPHGGAGFAVTFVAMQGDKIVGASLDEYQFMPKDKITAGVPNYDNVEERGMALNFKDENVVLASKRVNDAYYGGNMKEKAGATQTVNENFDAIEQFVIGKTIEEVQAAADKGDKATDAVSGATLADTAGYLNAILAAAKNAK